MRSRINIGKQHAIAIVVRDRIPLTERAGLNRSIYRMSASGIQVVERVVGRRLLRPVETATYTGIDGDRARPCMPTTGI